MKKNVLKLLSKSSTSSVKVISTSIPIVGGGAVAVTNAMSDPSTTSKTYKDQKKEIEKKEEEKKDKLFADWLKTANATETYEKWRMSPTGIKTLSTRFSQTPGFLKQLELWSKGTRRPYEYFKENVLPTSKYKSKFRNIAGHYEGFSIISPMYLSTRDYVEGKNSWIMNNATSDDKYQAWTQTQDFANKHQQWLDKSDNQETLKALWKKDYSMIQGNRQYLNQKGKEFNKGWWLNSSESQNYVDNWMNSLASNQILLRSWKASPHYQQKLAEWISVYPSKKSRADFVKDESLWKKGLIDFALKYTRTNRVKSIVKNLDEYVNAKNAWSAIGKSNWIQSGSYLTQYNDWTTSSQGQSYLKQKYIQTEADSYNREKDHWLLNDYAGKRSQDLWALTDYALSSYNNWKVLPQSESDLQTHWQSESDYTSTRDAWINIHKQDKNVWKTTTDANRSYDTWKTSQEGVKALQSTWETLPDYVTKKDQWILANPYNRAKEVWITLPASIQKYNEWRITPGALPALKVKYLQTNDYVQRRNHWLQNDYTNKRSKDLWAATSDASTSYNNWKNLPQNIAALKTEWQTKDDYVGKRDAWITTNKPDQTHWSKTQQAIDSYNTWKIDPTGEGVLKSTWESQQDYTTNKKQWINDNPFNRSSDVWVNLDDSTAAYNTWRVTDEGRKALKPGYIASNTYQTQKDDWIWNMYTNKRPMDQWAQTPDAIASFDIWKVNPSSQNEIKTNYLTTTEYQTNKNKWIQDNMAKRDKQDWAKSNFVDSYYNNWRVSSGGRAVLKNKYLASSLYGTKRDSWIKSHYTNKRNKTLWSKLSDARTKFGTWKAKSASQNALKKHWKTLNDYSTKRNAWIVQNKPNKDFWATTAEAQSTFKTWEALPNSSGLIATYYQTLDDYTTKRDQWISDNPIKKTKAMWSTTSSSNQTYDEWRLSIKGQEILIPHYQSTNDYTVSKDQWIAANYTNISKEQWSKSKAGKDNFISWAEDSANETTLKNLWKNSQDYADKKALWLEGKRLSLNEWITQPVGGNLYQDWKDSIAGYQALRAYTIASIGRRGRETIEGDNDDKWEWWGDPYDEWIVQYGEVYYKIWEVSRSGDSALKTAWRASGTNLGFEAWKAAPKANSQFNNGKYLYSTVDQSNNDVIKWENGENYIWELADTIESSQTLSHGQKLWLEHNGGNQAYENYKTMWDNNYQNDPKYLSNYILWRDNDSEGVNSGYNHYLTLNQSTSDYNSWITNDGLHNYHISDEFTSNLNTWSNDKNNGFNHYKNDHWSDVDYEKWAQLNLITNSEANYQNSNKYSQSLAAWKKVVSSGKTNSFKFYLSQNVATTDYTNWVPSIATKKTYDEWEKANAQTLSQNWINDAANRSVLENKWKQSEDYKTKLDAHMALAKPSIDNWASTPAALAKYQAWAASPEGIGSLAQLWEKTSDYQTRKSTWINGNNGDTSYQNWTTTAVGKNYLENKFKQTSTYSNAFTTWLNSNPKELNIVKYNWFFNEYKKTNPSEFATKLKAYYQSTNEFRQNQATWLKENNHITKDDWKNDAHFQTSLDDFKASQYGIAKMKAIFNQSDYFKKVRNNISSKKTKAQWKTTQHFKDEYVKWLGSDEAYSSLETDFKSSNDYSEVKFEQWKKALKKAYWKTTSAGTRKYNSARDKFIQATYGNTGRYHHFWVRSRHTRGYRLDSAGWKRWKSAKFDRSIKSTIAFRDWINTDADNNTLKTSFQTYEANPSSYTSWIDADKYAQVDTTDGFKTAFYKYITRNNEIYEDKWYDNFYNSSSATNIYNKWYDQESLTNLESQGLYEVVFDWYQREKVDQNVYLDDDTSTKDFDKWVPTTSYNQYLNSADFDEKWKNYEAILDNEVTDFNSFINGDLDLINAWNAYDSDAQLKSIFKEKDNFKNAYQTYVGDRTNGNDFYQSLNQGEIDYKNSPQYQSDLSTYHGGSNPGTNKTIGFNYYITHSHDWKKSQDYITKRNQWVANSSNYNTLSKLAWLKSSQGQRELNKFLNDVNLVESLKGAYLGTQEFRDNKDLWNRFNQWSKKDWLRTINLDSHLNNFVATAKGEKALQEVWKSSSQYQASVSNWLLQNYTKALLNNWKDSDEGQAKFQEWLQNQHSQEILQKLFEQSATYHTSKREFFEYNGQKRDILGWANSTDAETQFANWKISSSKSKQEGLKAWEKAIADGDDDMAQKATAWFNNKYSSDPLTGNSFETWYSSQDLTKWKQEFEKSSEYETYAKSQFSIDDWISGAKVEFLKSWTLERMLSNTLLNNQLIYITETSTTNRSKRHFDLIHLIAYYSDNRAYLQTHWKRSNIGNYYHSNRFKSRNFSNYKTKKYLDYIMEKLHVPFDLTPASMHHNIALLYKRLEKPHVANRPAAQEYAKWAKEQLKKATSATLYNDKLKEWVKERTKISNNENSLYKIEQYKADQLNWDADFTTWSNDDSNKARWFAESQEAKNTYASWNDTKKIINPDEELFRNAAFYQTKLQNWMDQTSNNVNNAMNTYLDSAQSKLDFITSNSLFETSNEFSTEFNSFKTSETAKKAYSEENELLTPYEQTLDDQTYQKYENSFSFDQDFNTYKKTKLNSGLTKLDQYFMSLDHIDKLYQEAKTQQDIAAYDNSIQSQSDLDDWNNNNTSGQNEYNNWNEDSWLQAFENGANYNSDLDTWTNNVEDGNDFSNGINVYLEQNNLKPKYNKHKINTFEDDYNKSAGKSDFETWKNKVVNNQSNAFSFYLKQGQSTSDYNSWIDPNGEGDYKASNQFRNDLDNWSSTKANGIALYKKDAQSNTDYNAWTDPSPIVYTENDYKSKDVFDTDFTSWKSTVVNGLSNEVKFYITTLGAIIDYGDWIDPEGEPFYQKSAAYQNNLDGWSSDKDAGKQYYKDSAQGIIDYGGWVDPNPLYHGEAEYKSSNGYQNDFESWRDRVTNNQTNGFSNYLSHNQADSDYNNWTDPYGESKYQATATYQSDFEGWRDSVVNSQSNGYSYYLNQGQSTTDYNNWVDLDGENDYLTTNQFVNNLNNWSQVPANAIAAYLNSDQVAIDYGAWVDPNPLYHDASGYKNQGTYDADFITWRDKVSQGQANGFAYYLNQDQATTDYDNWIDPTGEGRYQSDNAYQSDFITWRDDFANRQTKGIGYYLGLGQATSDYDNWADPGGEAAYQASNAFLNRFTLWFNANNFETDYKNSAKIIEDWAQLLAGEFDKSLEGQNLLTSLSDKHIKSTFKQSSDFQDYYDRWDDPLVRTEQKYNLDATSQQDLNAYYQSDDHKRLAYDSSSQSATDYAAFFNNRFNIQSYLNDEMSTTHLNKWKQDHQNTLQNFKNTNDILDLFYEYNNEDWANVEQYLNSVDYTIGLRNYIITNFKSAFKYYRKNKGKSLYNKWNDPVGIQPDPVLFKKSEFYLELLKKWSADTKNGLADFSASSIAKSMFDLWKEKNNK